MPIYNSAQTLGTWSNDFYTCTYRGPTLRHVTGKGREGGREGERERGRKKGGRNLPVVPVAVDDVSGRQGNMACPKIPVVP